MDTTTHSVSKKYYSVQYLVFPATVHFVLYLGNELCTVFVGQCTWYGYGGWAAAQLVVRLAGEVGKVLVADGLYGEDQPVLPPLQQQLVIRGQATHRALEPDQLKQRKLVNTKYSFGYKNTANHALETNWLENSVSDPGPFVWIWIGLFYF